MTVSPRDIQLPHYCYRAQRYCFLAYTPNYCGKYNIDYQLINIYQEEEITQKSEIMPKIFGGNEDY
jgi:hypothetical protein